jgi:hypothetical protein
VTVGWIPRQYELSLEQRRDVLQTLLLGMLRLRFGNGDDLDAQVQQRIANASLEQLAACCKCMGTATTLDEVLAERPPGELGVTPSTRRSRGRGRPSA